MNKLKVDAVKEINYVDWDRFVKETYNKDYSFQQQDGCKDRGVEEITVPSEEYDYENIEIPFEVNGEKMGISFQTWLNTSMEDTAKHFNPKRAYENRLFWERNFYPRIEMIINDLHKKGLIEEGEYQIKIDW